MTFFAKAHLEESRNIAAMGMVAQYLGRSSLHNMSKVCKSWYTVFNKVLWKDLPNLSPLLRLTRDMEGNFSACGAPNNWTSLTRFNELAAYVHSIKWSEDEGENLQLFNEWAIMHGCSRHPGDSVLPNLRSLSARCVTASGAKALVPWISWSLTTVEISIAGDGNAGPSILSALEERSPNITSFSFTMNHETLNNTPVIYQALLSAVQSMKGLRRIAIPIYASPGLHMHVLGAMPDLEVLVLHLMESLRECDCFNEPVHFAESSLEDDILDSFDNELDDLMALPGAFIDLQEDDYHFLCLAEFNDHRASSAASASPFPAVHPPAFAQPFLRLHTLHVVGPFAEIADILICNIRVAELRELILTVPSVQTEHEMAWVMGMIASTYTRLNLVVIHIITPANLQWIDTRPLGQVPHTILVGYSMFHVSRPYLLV